MSERGSFCTQHIGCQKCLAIAKKHLLENTKYLCSQEISSWQSGQNLPIIAGKIGGLYASEEIQTMRTELGPKTGKRALSQHESCCHG